MRLPSNNPSGSQSSGGFGSARMNSNAEPDFSEFMWMAEEDLEAFDNKVRLTMEEEEVVVVLARAAVMDTFADQNYYHSRSGSLHPRGKADIPHPVSLDPAKERVLRGQREVSVVFFTVCKASANLSLYINKGNLFDFPYLGRKI